MFFKFLKDYTSALKDYVFITGLLAIGSHILGYTLENIFSFRTIIIASIVYYAIKIVLEALRN